MCVWIRFHHEMKIRMGTRFSGRNGFTKKDLSSSRGLFIFPLIEGWKAQVINRVDGGACMAFQVVRWWWWRCSVWRHVGDCPPSRPSTITPPTQTRAPWWCPHLDRLRSVGPNSDCRHRSRHRPHRSRVRPIDSSRLGWRQGTFGATSRTDFSDARATNRVVRVETGIWTGTPRVDSPIQVKRIDGRSRWVLAARRSRPTWLICAQPTSIDTRLGCGPSAHRQIFGRWMRPTRPDCGCVTPLPTQRRGAKCRPWIRCIHYPPRSMHHSPPPPPLLSHRRARLPPTQVAITTKE